MCSFKPKKPPFELFASSLISLPVSDQRNLLKFVYDALPDWKGLDLWIHMQRRIADLAEAPRTEAGEGDKTGETVTHVPARPSPSPAPQRDAD